MFAIIKNLLGGMRAPTSSTQGQRLAGRRAQLGVEALEGRDLPSTVLPTVVPTVGVGAMPHVKVFDANTQPVEGANWLFGDGHVRVGHSGGILVSMGDGSVRSVSSSGGASVFMDGSVRFISDSVSGGVWAAAKDSASGLTTPPRSEPAVVDYFLKLEGVEGESSGSTHGVGGGGGAGKVSMQDFHFSRPAIDDLTGAESGSPADTGGPGRLSVNLGYVFSQAAIEDLAVESDTRDTNGGGLVYSGESGGLYARSGVGNDVLVGGLSDADSKGSWSLIVEDKAAI